MLATFSNNALAWFANRRPNPIPNTLPIEDIEKTLQLLCVVPGPDIKSKLSGNIPNSSFQRISDVLKQYEGHNKAFQWHHRPRIYTVLRLIGRLDVMSLFVLNNYMDSDLPLPPRLLPLELGISANQFLAIQDRCLTSAIDLEKGVEGRHLNLGRNGDEHFHVCGHLGSGGFG